MYISEKKTYQWGIIGNSTEAEDFATAIHDLIDAKLYSVALDQKKSSSVRTALSTAQDVYSSFEEVILEKEIDLIYVASSVGQRLDHIKAALACKKGVVYLPPLQVTEKEWDELCTTSQENGLPTSRRYYVSLSSTYTQNIRSSCPRIHRGSLCPTS